MCSHYEAPSPQRVAETFGVEPFEQGKLQLYPGYTGFSFAVRSTSTRNRLRCWKR